MEYQQVSSVSPAAPFSRKLSNGRGYGGKHVYDGIFGGGGGEVKLGSRVEDYREIFGGFGTAGSSIPILEVPELNENSKVSAVGAQRIDYGKIFGGFGDDDFGLPHEEFFAKPKKVKSSVNGTRSPAEARLRNAGSKHSNVSKEQKGSSPEPSLPTLDGVKQFNVSYNKSNPVKKCGTNGMTHVAQLHAVPGYTSLVDKITPSKMAEGGKPARSVLNDAHLNVNGSKSVKEDMARRKPVSGPQPSIDTHSFKSPAEFQKKSSRTRSISNDMPFDAFEIGLGKPVSGPQPSIDTHSFKSPDEFQKKSSRTRSISNDMPFDAFEIGLGKHPHSSSPSNSSYNNGGANISMNSKFGVSGNDASRGALGNHSPTFSDEEMYANSDAAASAAALRKAIEEAQMKIKIAKELMERKKEGLQNRAKTSFNNGWKAQKSEVKTAERSKRSNELLDREMRVKEDTPKQEFTGLSEHNATKASQLAPDFEYEKKSYFANNIGETHSMESKLTRTDSRLEEAEDSESTEEFFEAADYEEHREMPSEYEEAGNAEKMALYDHENKWREKMTAEEKIKMPECGEEAFKEHKVERELNSVVGAFQWNLYANFVKPARELHNQEENEKMRMSNNHEEAEQTSIVSDEWKDCETKLEKLHQHDKKAELPIQELEENEDMKELKDVQDSVETEKKQREALDHKEMENRSYEVPIREEYDGSLDDIHEKKANVEEQQENWDRVECGIKQGGWNLEEIEEKQNDLHRGEISDEDGGTEGNAKLEETEDGEILKRSDQMNETEKKREKICEGIETERIRSESHLGKEDETTMEVTEQALRCEGANLEMAKDANEQEKNENLGGSDNALGRTINFSVGDLKAEVLTVKERGRIMEVTEFSPPLQGTERESKAVENANSLEEQNCEIAGLAQGFSGLDRIKKQTADVTEALLIGRNGVYFDKNDINFESKQNHHVTGYKSMSNEEKCLEDVTIELDDDNDVDICEPEVGTNNEKSEKSSIYSHNERWSDDETESLNDPECCVEEAACEFGENNKNIKESEVITNHDKDEYSFESSHEDRWVDNGIDNKASQQPCIFEGQGKTIEIPVEEELSQSTSKKEENCYKNLAVEEEEAEDRWVDNGIDTKASQQPCIFEGQGKTTEIPVEEELSQSTGKKEENCCKNLVMEEKEVEDNLQKEVEVEKKHSRKKEEVKEREIEREKERIAVERAIREARERAFAEARERVAVERATAEAHQRLKAEVRERLEKAPSETNNKLAAEKASFEAKLKAERAAVERATAEARQRALEKALSEKAAFEARNQAEKSTAERLSSMSNSNGMNSRDKKYNDPGPSISRYPGSSNHGERFNGGNGESAQRSKATLERHQRTAERAAKVLEEKNMRDLLVQKEQAERNRLAETLDADVKRWSSGKERNLRALLSTLQYILGRDSGWQSIPLTELISSTAVKKAYRKATLFVHPDKLQQRGASIQQKYTCEKVFDLLKDAWNKFSAEER